MFHNFYGKEDEMLIVENSTVTGFFAKQILKVIESWDLKIINILNIVSSSTWPNTDCLQQVQDKVRNCN